MTDDSDGPAWPLNPLDPLAAFQEASEQAAEQQQQLLAGLMGGSGGSLGGQLGTMSQMATFKTRVQSGGRVSIPDAEREALDIEEGDIVQTVVIPVKRNRSDSNE